MENYQAFSEETQYECNLCEKAYKYPGTLRMHKLIYHKDIQKQFDIGSDLEQQHQSDQTERRDVTSVSCSWIQRSQRAQESKA